MYWIYHFIRLQNNYFHLPVLFSGLMALNAPAQLVTANEKQHIVYAGVANSIVLAAGKYDNNRVLLKASGGELRRIETGHYTWKTCGRIEGTVTFTAFYKAGNRLKPLDSSRFCIKKVPDPVLLMVGFERDLHYPVPHKGVRVEMIDFDYDIAFRVIDYTIELVRGPGDTLRIFNSGPFFNEAGRMAVDSMQPGNQVRVINLQAINDCEGFIRKLGPGRFYTRKN
jgi:GldM C-terminal domain